METQAKEVEIINTAEYDAMEQAAQEESSGVYVHSFKRQFCYGAKSYASLTFDFESLTGADDLDIQRELAAANIPLISPEFSGAYLARMAIRACTERDEQGRRVADLPFMRALPINDCRQICNRARSFLLTPDL